MQPIIQNYLKQAIQAIAGSEVATQVTIPIEYSRVEEHGDFSSSIALNLAKSLKISPINLANRIKTHFEVSTRDAVSLFKTIEVVAPGFINFFIQPTAWLNCLIPILEQRDNYGVSNFGRQKRVLLEFVSSNPTGPLHVGHGRAAAQGDILARLLKIIGYQVYTEYYINDAGRQMDILALSIWLRYLQRTTVNSVAFPSNAYQGEYIQAMAAILQERHGSNFTIARPTLTENWPESAEPEQFIDALIALAKNLLGSDKYDQLVNFGRDYILQIIQADLEAFNVQFDSWFSEKTLITSEAVHETIKTLTQQGYTYQSEGNVWFKSSAFGDDKDRVLLRKNNQPTYFAVDAAYRLNIFKNREFDTIINLVGADHHGYLARIHAVIQALGYQSNRIIFSVLQLVSLYRGTKKLPLSTRSGEFVTLQALREEVGNDAARLFFVLRRSNQPIDFDLALAKSESHQNPTYYLQYAYTRIASILRQLEVKGLTWNLEEGLSKREVLTLKEEIQLVKWLTQYPDVLEQAGTQYEPSILVNYLRELAKHFHAYYNHTPILNQDTVVRNARLALVKAIQQVLKNGFSILGIDALTTM